MRSGKRPARAVALLMLLGSPSLVAEPLPAVHQQRYCMGTMFDIVAYHSPSAEAERAIVKAMEEILRLDQVLSHFKSDSDLSRLVREGRGRFVRVDPRLFEVIQESLALSRRSNGKFDVTIAPLLKAWKRAQADGHRLSAADISEARRCVGYEKIQVEPPDRIRLASDCLEIDLGGIGKGYAVDRAMAVLKSAGIRHALVNAGGSSIAAIGAPPDRTGWPVSLGARVAGRETLLLSETSISTAQQRSTPFVFDSGSFGEILDPQTGAPTTNRMAVRVVAPTATVSDALDTTLVMLSIEEGVKLLAHYPD
ncbi:MAG: FAD:protein FMN transferase, partial [Vicinamibacterales bacterium]